MVLYSYWSLPLGICYLWGALSSPPQFGPYDVILEKLERCPDSGTDQSIFPTRLSKVSRNRAVLNGTFTLYPEFNEDSKMEVELQEWGNQGYRPRSIQFAFKTCSKTWKASEPNWLKFFASTGASVTGCPIPAGKYTSQDLEMDFRLPKIPVIKYNKYRAVVSIFHLDTKVGCSRFYIETVPKEAA